MAWPPRSGLVVYWMGAAAGVTPKAGMMTKASGPAPGKAQNPRETRDDRPHARHLERPRIAYSDKLR